MRKTTNKDKFNIMELFFMIHNSKQIAELLQINIWSVDRIITNYFKNDGLIIKSKL